jgi:phosphoribosylformylglycinamidine (FGAM) synthase PurS component
MRDPSPPLSLPVFAGQGIASTDAPRTRQQALLDASSASGSVLLSACHDAFHAELSSLSVMDLLHVQIDTVDFQTREDLVKPPKERYLQNAVIASSSLFLIQSLRYLALVEATGASTGSLTPFSDILKRNLECGLGITGFSSGILPACVVATSFSLHRYISTAVEAYRLALWIGIRSQLYRLTTLTAACLDQHAPLPWSGVLVGISRECAEREVLAFNEVINFQLLD